MDWRWTLTHIILGLLFIYAIIVTYNTFSGLYKNNSSIIQDVIPDESMSVDSLFLTLASNISSYQNLIYWSIIYIETYIISYFIYFLFGNLTINNFLLIFFFILVLLFAFNSLQQYYINRKLYQYGMKNIAFIQGKLLRSQMANNLAQSVSQVRA